MALVDRLFEKYGMNDPLLTDRPEEWRANYMKRALDRLPGDLVIAFDRVTRVEREKDKLVARVIELDKRLRDANLKIWILSGVVTGEFMVIGWLVQTLLRRLA